MAVSWQKNTATLDIEMLEKPTIFKVFFPGQAALHFSQLGHSTRAFQVRRGI